MFRKRLPDLLVGVAIIAGFVYLIGFNSNIVKVISLTVMVVSLVASAIFFIIDQERKAKP